MQFHIGWFANPIFLGQDYPRCLRDQLKYRLPTLSQDMKLLRSTECDFYGMNYDTSQFARCRQSAAPDTNYIGNLNKLQVNKVSETVKHLTRVYRLYGKPIIITENGCPCPGGDNMTREESVEDKYRIKYSKDHLDAISRYITEDSPVIQDFMWSLMDNLEWSDGYGPRFGVTFIDYETLERTPKKSALALKQLVDRRKSTQLNL